MSTVPDDGLLYSTRSCGRCRTSMAPGRDDRERRVWQCGSCGSTRR